MPPYTKGVSDCLRSFNGATDRVLFRLCVWLCILMQFHLSLDPVTARTFHDATLPSEPSKVTSADPKA